MPAVLPQKNCLLGTSDSTYDLGARVVYSGLDGASADMTQEALDTMGFFECPNLRRGLLREYRFLPWSLHWDWCDAFVGHTVFRDEQGRSFGQCLGPALCQMGLLVVVVLRTPSTRQGQLKGESARPRSGTLKRY